MHHSRQCQLCSSWLRAQRNLGKAEELLKHISEENDLVRVRCALSSNRIQFRDSVRPSIAKGTNQTLRHGRA